MQSSTSRVCLAKTIGPRLLRRQSTLLRAKRVSRAVSATREPVPRQLGSWSPADGAAVALQNGILEHDDYYRNGLPESKFALPADALAAIFEEHKHVDPYSVVSSDVELTKTSMRSLVGSDHPMLKKVADYFFTVQGKLIRPTIVFLLCRAMSKDMNTVRQAEILSASPLSFPQSTVHDSPAASADSITAELLLSDANVSVRQSLEATSRPDADGTVVSASQRRLSEITELIHTASLLHDDVIDEASARRGVSSLNDLFGNKIAILAGDFLLARASMMLSRLRNHKATELMSTAIEHLVKGEIMQWKQQSLNHLPFSRKQMEMYLTKNYYKTASLMANSCHAVAVLGDHDDQIQTIAYEYGKNIGMAFQIIDDILDYEGDSKWLGKAKYKDLANGLATAPALFAAEAFTEMEPMILRRFKQDGDFDKALELIQKSQGIAKSRELARKYAEHAVAACLQLPPSKAQSALIHFVQMVLSRTK